MHISSDPSRLFRQPKGYELFIVHAHSTRAAAIDGCVFNELIEWLKKIKVEVLVEKSSLLEGALGDER